MLEYAGAYTPCIQMCVYTAYLDGVYMRRSAFSNTGKYGEQIRLAIRLQYRHEICRGIRCAIHMANAPVSELPPKYLPF